MRYFLYGAGAVGGVLGASLARNSHEVIFIARGPHLQALQTSGVVLKTPDGDHRQWITAVASPAELPPGEGDVVFLTMKSQDTEQALSTLEVVADPETLIVCMQNGIDNERAALRRFARVCAASLLMPAVHLQPGIVIAPCWPVPGVIEMGRYPLGTDQGIADVVQHLNESGFDVRIRTDVMEWKHTKLLYNLGNVVVAAAGRHARNSHLVQIAQAEAVACFKAAAMKWIPEAIEAERRDSLSPMRPVAGQPFPGGSLWQSLERRTGSSESNFLNGEIVLLGRLHGISTPVNEGLRRLGIKMAADRTSPGSLSIEQVERVIDPELTSLQ